MSTKRDEVILVRVNSLEKERYKKIAELKLKNLSDYIRLLLELQCDAEGI